MTSDAVGTERVSAVVGYKITKGNFNNVTPNLPQRIALLGEANEANQGGLDLNPVEITTAQQAGELYGYGSPIYHAMRILRPVNGGGGIGGIPVYVYPQAEAVGAIAKILEINPVGVATGNGTHTAVIAGREGVDAARYDFVLAAGDSSTEISAKITDAINNVLGSPVIANDSTYSAICTSKWKGKTADDLTITIETNGNAFGITYVVENVVSAAGTPTVTTALNLFGTNWNTIVINTYGTVDAVMDELEAFNGVPDPSTPTGRYTGIVFKPFIALTGSVADNPSTITDTRLNDVTIAICPAPLSKGLPLEAAANMCLLFARIAQDTPHLDVQDKFYSDMPTPASIGSMADYNNRDSFVKKGCSTVDLEAGVYKIKDFVTTYHPIGETPPQFRYCRNLMLDFNVFFGYFLLEQINVVGKAIAANEDVIDVTNVIKPKQWVQIVDKYADDLASRALIAEASFMQESIVVNISTVNPDRLETFFKYKRTGIARISTTTAEAGFNFGS